METSVNLTRIARPGRLRLIIAAVIVAIAGLIIPLSQIASARTADGRRLRRRA